MGTTSEKLNYLNNTKNQLKDLINNLGGNLTDESTFRSYINELCVIYPKTTVTGTSLSISDTVAYDIKNFMLNSTELTQDGTPSPSSPVDVNVIKGDNNVKVENKNLLNTTWEQGTFDYTNNTNYDDTNRIRSSKFAIKPSTQYTFSCNDGLGEIGYIFYQENGITYIAGSATATNDTYATITTPANAYYMRIRIGSKTLPKTSTTNYQQQLEIGSTATDYVEHQEQNYPISLGGNEFEANKMSLGYYIDGLTGNLNSSGASNVSDYMEAIEGIEYTLNYSYVTLASSSSRAICYFDQNKNFIAPESPYTYYPSNKPIKITPPTNAKFVRFTLDKNITNVEFYPSNAIEYCKIGDYADQIFKNTTDSPYYDNTLIENEWYLKKNIQKTIIDKNTLVDVSFNTTSYSQPALLVGKSNFGRSSGWGSGYTLCNSYAEITSTSNVASGKFASNFGQSYLTFFNENFTDSTTALNLLHGVIVYIVRTTPTYIHITEEDYPILQPQLENIYNNAKSYTNTTNITQTNDDLPFNLSVDILKKGG